MKNKFNKKIICLAVAAIILTAGVSIKDAMAYFTTYVVSEGKEELELGFTETVIDEEVEKKQKIVTITNNGSAACYVRVKTFVADKYSGMITAAGSDWSEENGFYEYKKVLDPGKSTSTLVISLGMFDEAEEDKTPNFNVIVIQECAPVLYDADGNTYADWDGSDFNIDFNIDER